jgi:hypothetical protein
VSKKKEKITMKSRTFMIFFITTIFSLIAFPATSRAVTLPLEYRGELLVSVNYGTGHCEGTSPILIGLGTSGILNADYDMEVLVYFSGPNTCKVDHRSKTASGTHDKIGTFKLPIVIFPSELVVDITGTFDDSQITGTGSTTSANGLITVTLLFTAYAGNQPPKITLEPAIYPEFQMNILEEKGFTVKIRKEDGVMDSLGNWKINWSTLAFLTDGMDNSMNFIKQIIPHTTWSIDEAGKEIRFHIKTYRETFMSYNMFNIKFNGEHLIGLSVCDTDNHCGGAEYNIYFGPFITAQSVSDLRCLSIYRESNLAIDSIVLGNTGYASSNSLLYLLLFKAMDDYWFADPYVNESCVWHQGEIVPFGSYIARLTDGCYIKEDLKLPLAYSLASGAVEYKPFPAGDYQFYGLIIDNSSGASKGFIKDVTTCY